MSRSGRLLSEPSNYRWRTGHGVIQNLALLQIAAAFPSLPDSPRLKAVAVERFQAQMNYYVGREGVTLLHSAGYHFTGTYFLGMALRLCALNSFDPAVREPDSLLNCSTALVRESSPMRPLEAESEINAPVRVPRGPRQVKVIAGAFACPPHCADVTCMS